MNTFKGLILSLCLSAATLASAPALAAVSDLDGDGKSDVFWRHPASGETFAWFMNGLSIASATPSFALGDANWKLERMADFDGNGKADVLWRHAVSGEVYLWLMNGASISSSASVFVLSDLNWQIAAVGDFDGNGKADILWRHAVTGEVYGWLMNGASISSSASVFVVADLNWQVVGSGDFNGDGKTDILWRHATTGENYIWQMNGLALAASGLTTGVPDLQWRVAGVGDMNNDGKADIFWRHEATGATYIWQMNGFALSASAESVTLADLNWRLIAAGDYNGDGRMDLFWRHGTTGETYVWLMNPLAVSTSGSVFVLSDLAWTAPCATSSCNSIKLSLAPSRTSGVAPLAVFFDASGTTAAGTTRPFHDIEYRWNFGDPGSGNWGATPGMPNLSRNQAMGGVAAHVFETPGTYVVSVTAFDGKSSAQTAVTITVQDPNAVTAMSGANQICVSTDGNFAGAPAGCTQVTTSSFTTAMGSISSTKKRIVFKRGQTWTHTSGANITQNGPGIIGAWGAGAKPIVQSGSTINQLDFTGDDWRVMDLDIRHTASSSNTSSVNLNASGGEQVTLLRVDMSGATYGILANEYDIPNGGHPWLDLFVIDSTISNTDNNSTYISAERFAMMGSTGSTPTQHTFRFPQLRRSVISHNLVNSSASDKHNLKLHAPCNSGDCDILAMTGTFTEKVVISDNKFVGGSNAWTVSIEPQNAAADERLRDVIVERNWFTAGSGTCNSLKLSGTRMTARNNIIDMTGSSCGDYIGIDIGRRGIEPASTEAAVHNNTIFRSGGGSGFVGVDVSAANSQVKNNLAYAPGASSPVVVSAGGSGTVSSNNSPSATVSPSLLLALPLVPADFDLGAASNAINAGTAVPLFSDFYRRNRPLNGPYDRGAAERP